MRNHHLKLYPTVREVDIIYNAVIKTSDLPLISCPQDAYELLVSCWELQKIQLQEQFKVLLLNRGNRVLAVYHHSTGGLANTVMDLKLIFVAALKTGASSIILAHNHPSGNHYPSLTDKALTEQCVMAAKFLDMKVQDHIILSAEGYYSFADEGEL